MKTVYAKIVLLAIIGIVHSSSVCMLQPQINKCSKKATKRAIEVVNSLTETKEAPLALSPQRPAMEGNFFTELPKELRIDCVPSRKPRFEVEFETRELDFVRNKVWLQNLLNVSSTSRYSRLIMLRDNPELASFIRRSNGVRLEPNPTAAIKVAHERGLKSFVHDKSEGYERSYQDSIEHIKRWQAEYNEFGEKARYREQNSSLVKCSIQ